MIKTAKQLFLLQNTYSANSFFYYIKRLPVLGNIFPDSVYALPFLKAVFAIFYNLFLVVKLLFLKVLYLGALVLVSSSLSEMDSITMPQADILLNLLFFFTLAGAVSNCYVLEPKKVQNYAIVFLRMDAKKVALSELFQASLLSALGHLPLFLLLPDLYNLGAYNIISLLLILVACKLIGSTVKLSLRSKSKAYKLMGSSFKDMFISVLIASVSILFIYFNISLNGVVLPLLALFFCVAAAFSLRFLFRFQAYLPLYKEMYLQYDEVLATRGNSKAAQMNKATNYIELEDNKENPKHGYALLSDCFMKRHKKLLMRFTKRVILIEILILVLVIFACLLDSNVAAFVNLTVVATVPVFTYAMCFFNCGERTVKILFMNCDSEMLTYRFYRQPKAILEMFTLRLKALVAMDWLQSLPIALALPLILFVSGGTEHFYEYPLLFISIMALSTFFSVHNLVVYYLFQPYNKDVEMKNPIYSILKISTYVACYILLRSDPSFSIFGVAICIFCFAYLLISLPLAYRIAPKTFRLK